MNWLGYAILSAVFAGLIAILAKIGLREVDPTLATAARSVIMAVTLIVFVAVRQRLTDLGAISGRAWTYIALAGACGAASWLCYFRALDLGDALRVASVDRLSILVTTGLAVAVLGERISLTSAAGVALILAGTLLVARG